MEAIREMYNCDKYMTTIDKVLETIQEYGVAIVPNVLTADECDNMVSGMWDYIEGVTAGTKYEIKRDCTGTWKNYQSSKGLFPKHSMLLQHFGIGHSQFLWDVRQNKSVADVFGRIWGCKAEELLVSFDGASLHLPPEVTGHGWYRNSWLHVDQSYLDTSFKCVQGSVSGYDTNPGDATFAFYERSHLFHAEFRDKFGVTEKDNWYKLNAEQMAWYEERGVVEKRVSCPRGSLVLWDSRTVHCGVEPLKARETPNIRCVAYVCYQPRSVATPKDIRRKQEIFEAMRTTTHWAAKPKLFGKLPRTYGAEVATFNDVPKPVLTDFGKKLAGF